MNDSQNFLNAGGLLSATAKKIPDAIAIAEPVGRGRRARRDADGKRRYRTVTFAELDRTSDAIAAGLKNAGLHRGMKLVLMVRPGVDFITYVYALFKAGAVVVLIDPGMGLRQMLSCLAELDPDGFIAIPPVHVVRMLCRSRFPHARLNVTVGGWRLWGGLSDRKLRATPFSSSMSSTTSPSSSPLEHTQADEDAAIVFTSGSTGPAKGVLYSHGIIAAQAAQIAERFGIEPGGTDLAGFPFFGLFDAAHGTTCVIPDMDPTRPASVSPELYVETARDWRVTQSFASPALWNRVVPYLKERGERIPTLTRAISSGAPFPVALLPDFLSVIAPDGDVFTPYGATESLPVAAIGAREILGETAARTKLGRGVCVGRKFSRIEWRVIPISDEPCPTLEAIPTLSPGEIGELIVTGPQVTRRYVTRTEANALSKISDSAGRIWHRIGDVGWIDDQDRFWFCGRKNHRVTTPNGTLFSIPTESLFNQHPAVERAALCGFPDPEHHGFRVPFVFVILKKSLAPVHLILPDLEQFAQNSFPVPITHVAAIPEFPVDIRHNAKINREMLSQWAEELES